MRFKTVKLGELLDVLTDYHANGAYKKLKENVELLDEPDYAVMIRTTNFEQNDFASNLKYITEHAYNFLAKSKVYAGDIIMNKIANAGSSYLMPELDKPVSLAMNLFLLRINTEKANPTYVYIYLKIHEAYVKNFANGSVTKTITKEAVKNLEIQLPERSVQDSIVKIYFSLSDKIQLNQKTNQTLEQMAQAIFKSWFVDFEPTRAKVITKAQGADPATQELAAQAIICGAITLEQLQGYAEESVEESAQQREQESLSTRLQKAINEKLSQASAHPLNATTAEQLIATAALFPNELVESELGEVPKGWEVKALDEIAHYQNGLALQKFRPENDEESLPVLKIAQLRKGFADGEERASANIKPECIVDNGDVVFSWSGSLIVDIWCGGKVALNQHLFKVTSQNYPKWFYHYWTKRHLEVFQQIARSEEHTSELQSRPHLV